MKKIIIMLTIGFITLSCNSAPKTQPTNIIKMDLDDGTKIEKLEQETGATKAYLIKIIDRLTDLEDLKKNVNKREVVTINGYIKGSYELSDLMKKTIDSKLDIMKDKEIEVIGYADLEGNNNLNLILGLNRANGVKDYLVSKGIKVKYVKSNGFNSIVSVKENNLNRRVEIIIR